MSDAARPIHCVASRACNTLLATPALVPEHSAGQRMHTQAPAQSTWQQIWIWPTHTAEGIREGCGVICIHYLNERDRNSL